MKRVEFYLRVRYKDTDRMGIAYYSNYLVWFEVGRTEYFRGLGMPYADLEKNGIYLPVTKAYIEYKEPAYYDDELVISTWISVLKETRIGFNYEIYRENTLLAAGDTEHAFVGSDGKPLALSKHSPFFWMKLKKETGSE